MSKNVFTQQQLNDLKNNPNVESVTEKRITYTVEFKKLFVDEYRRGKGPRQIFKDAGFDVDALGYKRIERASDRWRTENNEGRLGENSEYVEIHKERRRDKNKVSLLDQLSLQAEMIGQLQLENHELRKQLAQLAGH